MSRHEAHRSRSEDPVTPSLAILPPMMSIDGSLRGEQEEDQRLLKPYSDINPLPLYRQINQWLQQPGHAKAQTAGSSADLPPQPPSPSTQPVLDLRQATKAQLAAAARRHNCAFNIGDPVSEALEGILEKARINDPTTVTYPVTLAGNPK